MHSQGGHWSATRSRYVRLHVNGHYLRYMAEYEHGNGDTTERYVDDVNKMCRHLPQEIPGNLFKSQGMHSNECAYGLYDACGGEHRSFLFSQWQLGPFAEPLRLH